MRYGMMTAADFLKRQNRRPIQAVAANWASW